MFTASFTALSTHRRHHLRNERLANRYLLIFTDGFKNYAASILHSIKLLNSTFWHTPLACHESDRTSRPDLLALCIKVLLLNRDHYRKMPNDQFLTFSFGLGLHALSDSYAHRRGDSSNFVAPIGHGFAGKTFDERVMKLGTEIDNISENTICIPSIAIDCLARLRSDLRGVFDRSDLIVVSPPSL